MNSTYWTQGTGASGHQVSSGYSKSWSIYLQMLLKTGYVTIGEVSGGMVSTNPSDRYNSSYFFNGHILSINVYYNGYDGTYPGTFDGQNVYGGWTFREKIK